MLDIFVAKFSRCLGPGCVDIVVLGEKTLFTLREQGTIRLQKMLGYQPACGCKYAVAAAPGGEGERLAGTTVDETDVRFSTVIEEENLIVAADTDVLLVYKVPHRECVVLLIFTRASVKSVFHARTGAWPNSEGVWIRAWFWFASRCSACSVFSIPARIKLVCIPHVRRVRYCAVTRHSSNPTGTRRALFCFSLGHAISVASSGEPSRSGSDRREGGKLAGLDL